MLWNTHPQSLFITRWKKQPTGNRHYYKAQCHLLATDTWYQLLFCQGLSLVPQWDTCLTVDDNYRVVWFVPSDTHLANRQQSQNKVLSITVFVLFWNSFLHGNTILGFHWTIKLTCDNYVTVIIWYFSICGWTIKFSNSPPCACHGSTGLMTLTHQRFTAALLLIYGSLFLSGIYCCLCVFWCAPARMSELKLEQRMNIKFLVKLGKSGNETEWC